MYAKFLASCFVIGALMSPAAGYTAEKESVKEVVTDAVITTRIKTAFAKDKEVSVMKIKVDTDKGVVKLSGTAKSKAEADKAVSIAKATKGVTSVKNEIQIGAAKN